MDSMALRLTCRRQVNAPHVLMGCTAPTETSLASVPQGISVVSATLRRSLIRAVCRIAGHVPLDGSAHQVRSIRSHAQLEQCALSSLVEPRPTAAAALRDSSASKGIPFPLFADRATIALPTTRALRALWTRTNQKR